MKHIFSPARIVLLTATLMLIMSSASAQRWNWISTGTGVSFDECFSLALAPSGDLYTVGVFSDSMNFDGQRIQAYGNYDVFLARYNNKGRIGQLSSHGGFDVDEARSVVADKNGNVYMAGAFMLEALVGGQLVEGISENSMDMWVAKFDRNGALQWVTVFGSPTYDEGAPSLAVDSLGNVYVAGGIGGTGEFGSRSYTSTGKLDIFVAKMTATGEFTWVQGFGGAENDEALSINVTPNGDRIYTCATFIGKVRFGSAGEIESFVNRPDFVVMAMNANGGTLWAKRIGYSGVDRHIASTVQFDGKLVVTGAMSQVTTFDTQTLTANGEFESDIFLCRFTRDGAIDLLKRYGGTFEDVGLSVRTDAKGAMYVGGYFDSTTTIGLNAAQSVGGRDGLVMRVLANGDVDWVQTMGGEYDDEIRGVVVDSKNIPYVSGIFDTWAYFGGQKIDGERFSDVFVAALECGPATWINPRSKVMEICEGQDSLIAVAFGYPTYEWYVDGQKVAGTTSRLSTSQLRVGQRKVYCRITGHDDCINNTDTVTVNVRPGLPVPTIVRVGEELRSSVSDVMYQWYLEGTAIPGATNQNVQIQGEGNYRVLISDTTGCSRWSDNYTVGSTSVFEGADGNIVTIYPNPTTGALTVEGGAGAAIIVSDALGRVVFSANAIANSEMFTINGASGVYAVTLRSGSQARTVFIVKQ